MSYLYIFLQFFYVIWLNYMVYIFSLISVVLMIMLITIYLKNIFLQKLNWIEQIFTKTIVAD